MQSIHANILCRSRNRWRIYAVGGCHFIGRFAMSCREPRHLSFITLFGFAALLSFMAVPTDAGFVTAPTYAVDANPTSVAVGDFNGDGIPDLAACPI
jgi:hypothetical protein